MISVCPARHRRNQTEEQVAVVVLFFAGCRRTTRPPLVPPLWSAMLFVLLLSDLGCGGADESKPEPSRTTPPVQSLADVVLQTALSFDGLQPYYHPQVLGRDTLRIHGIGVSPASQLMVRGNPVVVVSDSCLESENCVEVKTLRVHSDTAYVELWYPIEGVWCELMYLVDGDDLTLILHRISEFSSPGAESR